MIVSNFELLIKRIATVPNSTPTSISTVFRRVVQGYFLLVTNLESDRTIRLNLKLTITSASGNRAINSTNTQVFFDNGPLNNLQLNVTQLTSVNPNYTEFRTNNFSLRPRQTGLITVLPNVIPFINDLNPDLEIRGYVELKQRFSFLPPFAFITPAADVLVTPETRGTFLDNDYPTSSTTEELDFDQISYGIQTASGKSQNEVERVGPFIFDPVIVGDLIRTNAIASLEEQIMADNPDLDSQELKSVIDGLISMKGNKEAKSLMDEINKVKKRRK